MGVEVLAVVSGLLPIVLAVLEAILHSQERKRDKRNALARVEAQELDAALDRLDAADRVRQS